MGKNSEEIPWDVPFGSFQRSDPAEALFGNWGGQTRHCTEKSNNFWYPFNSSRSLNDIVRSMLTPAAGFASSSKPSCPSKQIQEAYTEVMRWRLWRKMFSHAPSWGTRRFCSESAPCVASPGRDLPACRGWQGWRLRPSQGSLDNIQGPSRVM